MPENRSMFELTFAVAGVPAPGGSKTSFVSRNTGKMVTIDACKRNAGWRNQVAVAAMRAMKEAGEQPVNYPLEAIVVFYMPRPKAHFNTKGEVRPGAPKYPTAKPDGTKLWRSTEDALTGIVWVDDSQVVNQSVKKRYVKHITDPPGAHVTIEEMS